MEKSDLDFLSYLLPRLVPIRETLSLSHIGACVHVCRSMDCNLLGSLSMEFFRQEHWRRLPFPIPGVFQIQGWNLCLLGLLHCMQILYNWATWEPEP